MNQINVVSAGSGWPELMTREAEAVLAAADLVWLAPRQPAFAARCGRTP